MLVSQLASPTEWTCPEVQRVHPYSPQADLMSCTLRRR